MELSKGAITRPLLAKFEAVKAATNAELQGAP